MNPQGFELLTHSTVLSGREPPPLGGKVVFSGLIVVTGEGSTLLDGAIAIEDHTIVRVGRTEDVMRASVGFHEVPATGYMAVPGLFNAHTHVPMSFFRGLGHERKNMIETFLFPAEKSLTADLVEPLSYSYIYSGLRAGVTCFGDHYYFSEGVGRALDRVGVRGVVGETTADLGGAFPTAETWKRARDLIQRWPFSSRITPAIAPHAADTVSERLLKECAAVSKTENLPLHLHLSQTKGERQRVMSRYGMSPVKLAQKNGILGPRTLAVHLISADDEDLKILGGTGVTAGFCPTSQIIYEHLAPIEGFVANNIPFAVGTDCAASNDNADMMAELKLTSLLLKESEIPAEKRDPEAVLRAATLNPAKVFGLDKKVGSIKAGKAADIVFLRRDLGTEPMLNPFTNFIYTLGSQHIDHVMVDGRWALWQRKMTQCNEEDLLRAYQGAVAEIRKRVGLTH